MPPNFLLLFTALMAVTASAHMHMIDPAPLGAIENKFTPKGASDSNYNSPLKADGSDFPCKAKLGLLGTDAATPVAKWAAGSQQSFSIGGGAAHNGGSCQASLSEDGGKTWKVIKSYVGGCPIANGGVFSFTVPSAAKSGDALFAWSWFNQVGVREMYMNCAAVTITGGSGSGLSSLPNMFVANIGNGCASNAETTGDMEFPNPGKDIQRSTSKTSPPTGNCAFGSSGGSSDGKLDHPAPTFSNAPAPTDNRSDTTPTKTFDDGSYHPPTQTAAKPIPTSIDPAEPSVPVKKEEYEIVMVIDGKTQTGKAYLTKPTAAVIPRHRRGRRTHRFFR